VPLNGPVAGLPSESSLAPLVARVYGRPGGKHAAGGALPAPARQRLASALVAENEGQRMALASKTALIRHHLLRDQREGDVGTGMPSASCSLSRSSRTTRACSGMTIKSEPRRRESPKLSPSRHPQDGAENRLPRIFGGWVYVHVFARSSGDGMIYDHFITHSVKGQFETPIWPVSPHD
jgi:hypothetical protein